MFIVMLLSVIAANAQETSSEIRKGFEKGVFYLLDDSFTLMFACNRETRVYDEDDNMISAEFKVMTLTDAMEKGAKWFKDKMSTEEGKNVLFQVFYKSYGLVMDSYRVDEEGTAYATFTIMEKRQVRL